MSVQVEVTTENLLSAVVQMPEGEFNYLLKKPGNCVAKGITNSSKEADSASQN